LIKAAVVAAIVVSGLLAPRRAEACSVLAHEANVDALWDGTIAPMLLARFVRCAGVAATVTVRLSIPPPAARSALPRDAR
jgi:hypothetical protein